MYQSFFWILFFTILGIVPVNSQPSVIIGRIVDQNYMPLIGANVLVKGTVLGSATDLDGNFQIRGVTPGDRILQISMIGFQKKDTLIRLRPGEKAELNIILAETPIQTKEVVITAGRRAQSFEEIPVSIAVFDGRDVERRTIVTLDQALRYIPGVNMTEYQVNIRGSSGYSRGLGTRVLLLLDGVPFLSGDANEIKFDAIPMYMIDRIEVVKGAGSALYGSSALGGVINVLTKAPAKEVYKARIYTGMYDDPWYSEWKWWGNSPRFFNGIDIMHGNTHSGLSYLVNAGLRNNQGYRQKDDSFKWSGNGKLAYQFTPDKNLTVSMNSAYEDRGNWVFWRDLRNALVPPKESDLTERVISKKIQAMSQFRQTISSDFAYTTRGYFYQTAHEITSDTSDFSFRPFDRTQSTASVYGFELQGTIIPAPSDMLVTGIDLSYSTVNSHTYGNRDGFTCAIFFQNDYSIKDQITLSAGTRFDFTKIDTADSDNQINPRVGIAYTPIQGTILRGSYGWGFRAPSIAERFATASAGGLTTKPNPNLKSERSTSYEIGIKQELLVPVVIDGAVFLNDYKDLVEPVIDPEDGKIVFQNITSARIIGAEIGIITSLLDRRIDLSCSYTYLYPRDRLLRQVLKYRPRHLLYASGLIRVWDITIGADSRFISRIEEIDQALALVIPDTEKRVAAYVTDIRIGYDFQKLGVPLISTLSINNLFQYNYSEIVANIAPIRSFTFTLETAF